MGGRGVVLPWEMNTGNLMASPCVCRSYVVGNSLGDLARLDLRKGEEEGEVLICS